MNRRTTIGILGFIAVSGVSMFKWFSIHKDADIGILFSSKKLIAELAETIIPRTDTPGAKDAKVEDFIIDFMMSCAEMKNRNLFLNGLTVLQAYANDIYGLNYEFCKEEQKIEILTHFEQEAESRVAMIGKIKNKLFGRPFFYQLKELSVIGYATSQPGATKGLAYDYIPGAFYACTKLLPNQKSWATK